MAFLDEHGTTARVFYNNIVYLAMTLLGALVLASLNAEEGDNDPRTARYELCRLDGSTGNSSSCPTLNDDQEYQLLQLFNISVSIVVVNVLCFIWSVATHWGYGIETHFMVQWALSAVNLGLFSGLVGWYNASEGLAEEANIENNVYFTDFNPYAVAIVGVVAGVLDLVLFNALKLGVFKARCDAGTSPK